MSEPESASANDAEARSILANLYELVCTRSLEDKEYVRDQLLNHKHLLDENIGFWCETGQTWCPLCDRFEWYPILKFTDFYAELTSSETLKFVECIRQGYCSCKQKKNLLSFHASFFKTTHVGVRLIHLAARLGVTWLVELLIDQGCYLNPVTPLNKFSPLHIAAQSAYTDIVQLLLDRGAAIFKEALLSNPDEPNLLCYEKYDLLHEILAYIAQEEPPLDGKEWQQFCHTFKLLVQSGIWDVDRRDDSGETVLMSAVENELVEQVDLLLAADADPNLLCDAGFSPLFRAVEFGNYVISSALIEAGADVNYVNKVTLLQTAVEDGFSKIAELLLQNGADPNLVPGGSPHPLVMAICDHDSQCVVVLIKHGANVNARREDGVSALHLAAFYGGNDDSIHLLLKHGADVHARDIRQSTPMHFAAYSGNHSGILELLKFGAEPDVFNCIDASPLWYAVAMQRTDIVQTLLKHNVTMETSSYGDDPGSEQMAKIYQSKKSVLWVAVETSGSQIVEMLLQAGYNIWLEPWLVEGNAEGLDKDKSMEIFQELQDVVKKMPSLLCLCRFFLRGRFGSKLHVVAEELPLPQTLKEFLR